MNSFQGLLNYTTEVFAYMILWYFSSIQTVFTPDSILSCDYYVMVFEGLVNYKINNSSYLQLLLFLLSLNDTHNHTATSCTSD